MGGYSFTQLSKLGRKIRTGKTSSVVKNVARVNGSIVAGTVWASVDWFRVEPILQTFSHFLSVDAANVFLQKFSAPAVSF